MAKHPSIDPPASDTDYQLVSAAHASLDTRTGATPLVAAHDGSVLVLATSVGAGIGPRKIALRADDYASGVGTAVLRTGAGVVTNAAAPVTTMTLGLYPITAMAGGAGVNNITLGAVVSGSTAVVTSPPATALTTAVSADFAFPADGLYILGLILNQAGAANSNEQLEFTLQIRRV